MDEQVKLQYRDMCLENFGLSDQVIIEYIPSGSDVDEVRVREKMEILGQTQRFSLTNCRRKSSSMNRQDTLKLIQEKAEPLSLQGAMAGLK